MSDKDNIIETIQSYLIDNRNLPIIIIDPKNSICCEDCLNNLHNISIDLSLRTQEKLKEFIVHLSSHTPEIVLIKNIDKIPKDNDIEYWESIITIGLKGEEYPIQLETEDGYHKTYILPFDKIKLIATCSKYPEFLKDKGVLGYIVNLS